MKLLFINKPFFIEPLGIMHLSAVAKKQGHQVDLALTTENLESKLAKFKPDIVGYSIMTGDQESYDKINAQLKENYAFKSIAGGPHPTFFPEMLERSSFDAICRGEGEQALSQFLANPSSKQTPNFTFKTNNGIRENDLGNLTEDLDELPFPDREIVFQYPKISEGPIKHFIASRGCPYDCSYCFNHSFSDLYSGKGKRVRFRSVDNVLDEVEEVVSSSPTKVVYFQDDTFILKKDWVREFSEKYPERIGLPFHCHTRANLVNEEIVQQLKDAGCYSVHIAAESGNPKVREELLGRKMTNGQIIDSVHLFREYGIKTMLQNILGLPLTTLEDDFQTLDLNIQANPDYAWASIFQPYPKTRLGQIAIESGQYKGDFSDIGNNFFDGSILDLPHKNEIANLQKLFAITVANPQIRDSGKLISMIKKPYQETKEKYTKAYKSFRNKADRILYGVEL